MFGFLSDSQLFVLGSVFIAWWSRKPLLRPGSHGFYRFFAWEAILALMVMNRNVWGSDPLSPNQLASWPLLAASILLALAGVATLVKFGRAAEHREDGSLYGWERTTSLVTSGIYAHIRHPMYASLLALTWGAFLQAPHVVGLAISLASSVLVVVTTLADERECLAFFGPPYADYMRATKRYIPGIF